MENEEKECPTCARHNVTLSDYPDWKKYFLGDCINRLDNEDAGIYFGLHLGDPTFVLEDDPNPAKGSVLFFKENKKYVYLAVVSMGDDEIPKEHIPIVRICKPCMGFIGEQCWDKYLPKEFWKGYEQAVLRTLKRMLDDPDIKTDDDLKKYAREIVHSDMSIDW